MPCREHEIAARWIRHGALAQLAFEVCAPVRVRFERRRRSNRLDGDVIEDGVVEFFGVEAFLDIIVEGGGGGVGERRQYYMKKKAKELRELLKKIPSPSSGKKDALVDRLLEYEDQSARLCWEVRKNLR